MLAGCGSDNDGASVIGNTTGDLTVGTTGDSAGGATGDPAGGTTGDSAGGTTGDSAGGTTGDSAGGTTGDSTDGTAEAGTITLPGGVQAGPTLGSAAEAAGLLEGAINANPALTLVTAVDHQANAANVGLELRPTRVTIFGNPNLGTPLMQVNPLAGLDLPQKMLTWTDAEGQSNIAYNSAGYLSGRYGLESEQTTIDTIDNALAGLASTAAGQTVTPTEVTAPSINEGIRIIQSANDFDTTYELLRSTIDSAGALTIVSEVDHSANAANVGLTLRPTRLIIFGNPNLGTPLMQSGQSIAIDLPQKMLVVQKENGISYVAFNDPEYLASRHGITDQTDTINTIAGALNGLAATATTAQ